VDASDIFYFEGSSGCLCKYHPPQWVIVHFRKLVAFLTKDSGLLYADSLGTIAILGGGQY
jgi:hypothetical protein